MVWSGTRTTTVERRIIRLYFTQTSAAELWVLLLVIMHWMSHLEPARASKWRVRTADRSIQSVTSWIIQQKMGSTSDRLSIYLSSQARRAVSLTRKYLVSLADRMGSAESSRIETWSIICHINRGWMQKSMLLALEWEWEWVRSVRMQFCSTTKLSKSSSWLTSPIFFLQILDDYDYFMSSNGPKLDYWLRLFCVCLSEMMASMRLRAEIN